MAPIFASAQTSLQFIQLTQNNFLAVQAQGAAPMAQGKVAIYGWVNPAGCILDYVPCSQTQSPLLSILNAAGQQTAILPLSALGSGASIITSAAVDSSGDIWIAGVTQSDDFPLVKPIYSQKQPYAGTSFVAKLDPNLNALFASYLGDHDNLSLVNGPAYLFLVSLDAQDNAFVVGATNDPAFPVTGSGFGSGAPSNVGACVFATKFAADASKVIFSGLLGAPGDSRPAAAAVDSSGNLTIAGNTNAAAFPVTANAYYTGGSAFVSRISADGSKLIWSTEVGTAPGPMTAQGSAVTSMALDASANVYLVGTAQSSIATTPGALQPEWPSVGQLGGWAMKLSSDATQLLYATNLAPTLPLGITLDSSGNAWIAGFGYAPNLLGLPNAPAGNFFNFALELNANASAVEEFIPLIAEAVNTAPAFDSNGNLLLLGFQGNLLRVNPANVATAPAVMELLNAAIPTASPGIAAGEIVTLYGVGLGPTTGMTGVPDSNGLFPTGLGGVSVRVGNVDAPLLYVGPYQINFQVPFQLSSPTTAVTVTTRLGALPPMYVREIESVGVFGVLNPDGSANSQANPAPEGSIVSLFVTGLGAPGSQAPNGAVSISAQNAFLATTFVGWSNVHFAFPETTPLGVLYAGTAPGEINGLDQVNVLLPAGVPSPTIAVVTLPTPVPGGAIVPATSNGVTVYTK